jgi:hypothetical protein
MPNLARPALVKLPAASLAASANPFAEDVLFSNEAGGNSVPEGNCGSGNNHAVETTSLEMLLSNIPNENPLLANQVPVLKKDELWS